MYKSGYDYYWRIWDEYASMNVRRDKLLMSLVDGGVAVKECPAWGMVKTKSLPPKFSSMYIILIRVNELHDEILQHATNFKNYSQEDRLNSPSNVLKEVIKLTYGGEMPNTTRILNTLDEIIHSFANEFGPDIFKKRFGQLYYDSLLLKYEDVRAYFQKKHMRQARETAGLMLEDRDATTVFVVHPPSQPPVAPTLATEALSTSLPQPPTESIADENMLLEENLSGSQASNTGNHVPGILWLGKSPPAVRDDMCCAACKNDPPERVMCT